MENVKVTFACMVCGYTAQVEYKAVRTCPVCTGHYDVVPFEDMARRQR